MTEQTLDEALAAAEAADPANRVPEWKGRVAAFGIPALEPLLAWLPSGALGRFALVTLPVIADGGTAADRRRVVRVLQDAAPIIPTENHTIYLQALGRLGVTAHVPGLKVFGGPIHHVLADTIGSNPTEFEDLFLTECGSVFSGGHVRRTGGVVDSGGRMVCMLCLDAMKRGFEDPIERRRSAGAPDTRTWVLRNKWHEVQGWAQGDRLGDVYLTCCWRWILVSGKDVVRGLLRASEDETCLQCASHDVSAAS